jgi:hypothetical protein
MFTLAFLVGETRAQSKDQKQPPAQQQPPGGFSISVTVPVVNVDELCADRRSHDDRHAPRVQPSRLRDLFL